MRIQCPSCEAFYTVAEEKIGKRRLRIRCKKCSTAIVIDGTAPRDDDATTKAFDYAGGSHEQWTVNVNAGDQRTMTTEEIAREYTAGVVDDDTYCWKDGMADWLPIREIEQLYGVAKNPPPRGEAVPPAESEPEARPSAARREGGRGRGADLFGNAEKAGSEDEYAVTQAAPSPAPPAAPTKIADDAKGPKLTGARDENSVLFSLASLTSETTGKGGDGGDLAAPPSSRSPSSSPSEASGLIDIRALSVNKDDDDGGAPKKGGSKESRVEDIMNLSGGGAFGSPLAAPVLGLPAESSSIGPPGVSKPNRSLVPAILGGSALIAIGIVVAVILSRAPAAQPVGTGPTATTTRVATAAPTSSVAVADSTNATGGNLPPAAGTGEASAKVAELVPPDKSNRPIGVVPATAPSAAGADTKPVESAPAASAPATETTPTAAPAPDKPQDFAAALASAVGKTDEKPPENATGGASGTPFDRGAASGALGGIDVQECKKPDGPTGPGHVNVTFAPDGSVASAVVDQGPFPGTAVGGCVAGKFRGAHVPAFSGGPVKVGKSFTIN
jgi:predicted Zn finger-like uncharacterized protein